MSILQVLGGLIWVFVISTFLWSAYRNSTSFTDFSRTMVVLCVVIVLMYVGWQLMWGHVIII